MQQVDEAESRIALWDGMLGLMSNAFNWFRCRDLALPLFPALLPETALRSAPSVRSSCARGQLRRPADSLLDSRGVTRTCASDVVQGGISFAALKFSERLRKNAFGVAKGRRARRLAVKTYGHFRHLVHTTSCRRVLISLGDFDTFVTEFCGIQSYRMQRYRMQAGGVEGLDNPECTCTKAARRESSFKSVSRIERPDVFGGLSEVFLDGSTEMA
jgi:hypothetical protein